MNIEKLIADCERSLSMLRSNREITVRRAHEMTTGREAASTHLGHNLGNVANEISEYDARIQTMENVLASLLAPGLVAR